MCSKRRAIVCSLIVLSLVATGSMIVSASVNYERDDSVSSVNGYTWREMGFSERKAFVLGFYVATEQKTKPINEIPKIVNKLNNYYNSERRGKSVDEAISAVSKTTTQPSQEFIRITITRLRTNENMDCASPLKITCTGTSDMYFIMQACGQSFETSTMKDPELNQWHDLSISKEFHLNNSSGCRVVIKMKDDDSFNPGGQEELFAETSFYYDTSEGHVQRRVSGEYGTFIYKVEPTS